MEFLSELWEKDGKRIMIGCSFCGYPNVYAKGLCRNCYARSLHNGTPNYKEKRCGGPNEKQAAIIEAYNNTNDARKTAEKFGCTRSYVYGLVRQFKKITKADRIREMTDEELADELISWFAAFEEREFSRDDVIEMLQQSV